MATGYLLGRKISVRLMLYLSALTLLILSTNTLSGIVPLPEATLVAFAAVLLVVLLSYIDLTMPRDRVSALSALVLFASLIVLGFSAVSHGLFSWRRSVSIPTEIALSMGLIAISYPRVARRVAEVGLKQFLIVAAIVTAASSLTGFRADPLLIVIESLVIAVVYHDLNKRDLTFLVVLAISIVGVLSLASRPLSALNLVKRFYSTVYYFSLIASSSVPRGLMGDPLWIFRIGVHPTQFVGRAVFGRNTGITTTMFGNFLLDFGPTEMILMSLLVGIFSGWLFTNSLGDYIEDYSILLALLVTRMEIGFSQLDLLIIPALAFHVSLIRVMRSSRSDREVFKSSSPESSG